MAGRRCFPARQGLLMALALSAAFFSCEPSSGFLTDSERNSVYSLTLNASDGGSISNGAVLLPGTEISATVAKKAGASELAALDFSLSGKNGENAAGLRLFTAAARKPAATAAASLASKSVAVVDGKNGGFFLPEGSAPGSYVLSASISGSDGEILQKYAVNVFIGHSRPIIGSVSIFPPSVEPGASVLLGVIVSWLPLATQSAATTETHDPWIRWRKDGGTFAEGLLSSGMDKVVWSAPLTEGAFSLSVEVFPAGPAAAGPADGASFSFKAPVRQDIKVMVIAPPGGSGNDFADPMAFFSLLRFDGSFYDVGTRPRIIQPQGFGSPALDTYASGFGYRFGSTAGVRIPGLMPPTRDGALAASSTLLRLDSDQGDGILVRFASDDGSYALVLGIKDSRPYVESLVAGTTQRSTALSVLPRFPLTIEAILKPDGDRLSISWNAEGESIEAPSISLPPPPPEGSAQIGGPLSLPGVYDGFGIISGGASPSYRLASRRKWKAALVVAESFEDGVLPPLATASGSVSALPGSLLLEPGAAIALEPSFGNASAYIMEADIEGDRPSCAMVLSTPQGDRVLSVNGTGDVFDATGKVAGSLAFAAGRVAFSLEPKDGTIYLRGAEGSDPVALRIASTRFALSLRRDGGSGRATFDRVLVRASSATSSQK